MPRILRSFHIWAAVFLFLVAALMRFPWLEKAPNGFNWDEAAYAYNAYSLLQTGQDEWGHSWPIFLKSFGEYKPALLSYMIIPALWLLPDGETAARGVMALLGCLAVVATYGFVWRLTKRRQLSLLTALTLAVSPWHMHFTRVVLDPGLAHSLLMIGLFFWAGSHRREWMIGSWFLGLSMYAYNAERLFVPLIVIAFAVCFWRDDLKKHLKLRWPSLVSLAIICVAVIGVTFWGTAGERARQVSFLDSGQVKDEVSRAQQKAHELQIPILAFSHNPRLTTAGLIARQYGYYWRPDFLFFSRGGVNASPLLGFPDRGNLPEILAPFFVIGLIVLVRRGHTVNWFFLIWALVATLPGALTTDGPHAGRALIMLPALNFFIAAGLLKVRDYVSTHLGQKPALAFILLLIGGHTLLFMLDYYAFYPSASHGAWQGQFKDMSRWLTTQNAQNIYWTSKVDTHALYFYAWYTRVDPDLIQTAKRKEDYPSHLIQYGNVHLLPDSSVDINCALSTADSLVILSNDEARLLSLKPYQDFSAYFKVYRTSDLTEAEHRAVSSECEGADKVL